MYRYDSVRQKKIKKASGEESHIESLGEGEKEGERREAGGGERRGGEVVRRSQWSGRDGSVVAGWSRRRCPSASRSRG